MYTSSFRKKAGLSLSLELSFELNQVFQSNLEFTDKIRINIS